MIQIHTHFGRRKKPKEKKIQKKYVVNDEEARKTNAFFYFDWATKLNGTTATETIELKIIKKLQHFITQFFS